jgi:membrane fusion protein, macrolide-specific efflux system
MTERTSASWVVYALGALCAGAIVAAFLVVGPASGSQATVTRTAKAAQGVVQSTVSGSGNLAAASQLNLGFKTGGTVTNIYVTQGQQVTAGQLLARLNPESAEVTLEQSKAALQSAEANLAKEEETGGETGASQNSGAASAADTGGSGSSTAATASVAYTTPPGAQSTTPSATTMPAATAPSTTSGTTSPSTTTSTTPVASTPGSTTSAPTTSTSTTPPTTPASGSPSKRAATTTGTSTGTGTGTGGKGSTNGTQGEATNEAETGSSASSSVSAATREANLASARAAVKSDRLTVRSDEEAVQDTKLYAPEDGTIVSLSGQVGEVVSGSGTTKASSTGSSSSGSGASATGGASALGGTSGSSSASKSSSSSSSSSSAFAVLSDLSSMQLVVPLSESEIGNVKAGQPATVTVEALNGAKLAAHVGEVALLSSSSSGAVSYDVTFQLDQMEAGLKVGMSATAEVVVKQAEGVNVPTSAITADSVTVERGGKQLRQRVTTGLAGNTSTIVLSGLKAGETIVLPAASSTGSSTGLASKLGGRTGAGGLGGAVGGGGGGFAGGGGPAFFRGGG